MLREKRLAPVRYDKLIFPGGYAFSKNGRSFVVSKSGDTVLLEERSLRHFCEKADPGDAKPYLLSRGILKPVEKHPQRQPVSYFIIDLVKNCNFNCIYCFRNLNDRRVIPVEILDEILRFIRDYCEEKHLYRIGLQMWGGEPLMALERIEQVVRFFSSTRITASIDVETNGSLVTDEIARSLHEWGIHVGVSLDGSPVQQNLQRPFVNGIPSSDSVEKGVRNLQKYYHDEIGGIAVVTKYNYKNLKEMLDYYIYHLRLTSMKFNVVRDNPNASATGLSLSPDEVSGFANELMDYLYAYKSMGCLFSEGNMDTRLGNLLYQRRRSLCISRGCQGGRRIVSFSQDGGIFPCEMTDFEEERIGSVFSGRPLEEMIDEAMRNKRFFLPKEAKKCKNCPWWCYCRGGCTSRNRYMGIDGKPDESECAWNRTVYPKIVEAVLDGMIKV